MRLRKIVAPQRINKIFSHGPILVRSTGRSLNPNLCDEKWQLTNSSRSCLPSFLAAFLCCCQLFPFCLVVIKISKRRLFISFLSLVAFVGTVCVCVSVCVCVEAATCYICHALMLHSAWQLRSFLLILEDRAGNFVDNLPRFVTIWVSLPSLPSFLPSCLLLPSLSAAFLFFRHY